MEAAAKTFFSAPRYAVAGASADTAKFGYKLLAWYHARQLPVTPVTPSRPSIRVVGTDYPAVSSVSQLSSPAETSLSIVTQPHITLNVLREAKEAGISSVWLQPGSFDEQGLEYAKKEFKAAVGGQDGGDGEGCETMLASVAAQPVKSFSSEAALSPKLDVNVGAKSHFFQPPAPSAVKTLLQQSTTSEDFTPDAHRKQSRHQYSLSDSATPCSDPTRGWDISSGFNTPNVASPAPFVNTQYRLAGGLDTPTAALTTSLELNDRDGILPGLALRGGTRSRPRGISSGEYFPIVPYHADLREANGRPRLYTAHQSHDGWGRTIYNVIGAAGKVWHFCKNGAFKGFYAGKGPGYALPTPMDPANDEALQWHDMDEKAPLDDRRDGPVSIPGRFPEEDFIEDYMSLDHNGTPPRAAKKIQRSKGEGRMRESWVMVDRAQTSSREGSPVRLSGRKLPASSASGQRPVTSNGRKTVSSSQRPSLTSYAGSPGMRLDRPASFASPRSPLTSPKRESPSNVEMQRHAARIRRREMEEDANLKRFNHQLKAMIRQGKEALRTTVEITDENDVVDEGCGEGNLFEDREKG
ncbi:MAG: hypothetical protein Q9218_003020 [Villophora microphyllina]